ncbi:MAG: VOC family protein [Pseudonocardiaceae bacterium]
MITRIHWAMLGVADQDTMIEFFVDKLGFEKRTDAEMWPGARWVEVVPKGERTGLVLSRAADFGREPSTEYPVGFSCPSLPEPVEKLRAAGVPVIDPVTEGWGSYIRVTDPEGREFLVNDQG